MLNFVEKKRLALAEKCLYFGKFEYVEIIISKLLEEDKNNAELLKEVSILYLKMKNYKAAQFVMKKSFDLEKTVEGLNLLANINMNCGNFEDAAIQFEELIKHDPSIEIYNSCIKAYQELNIDEEALRISKQYVEDIGDANAYANLFFIYVTMGMEKESIETCEVIKKKFPNHPVTYSTIAFLYETIYNDYETAKEYFKKAAKLGFIESYYNLGVCCKQSEDFENAEKYLKKLISLASNSQMDYNYTLGSVYMAQRKLRLGYKYYLNRKSSQELNYRNKNNLWDGKDYPDKILYVSSEQGLGDNIQFIRFIPEAAKKFKKVIYSVNENLVELFQRSYKKYKNIEIVPNGINVRYHKFTLIMDLPYLLHTNFHNIPSAESYLECNEEKQEIFKTKYFNNENCKIGLCWRAKGMGLRDAVYRTIDAPYYFRKLFDLSNVNYYSFQFGDIFGMCEKYPQIIDLQSDIKTFDDTAALLKNLDILITVDTAIAHIAGALGVKTYLLLCHAPDWRWFENNKKTEWYPSITIIKQQDRKTWEDVSEKLVEYITEDLKKYKK